MEHYCVAHVGEIFHPVEVAVIPYIAVYQFYFSVGAGEDVDLGQRRRVLFLRAHVGPNDTSPLFNGIPEMADLTLEIAAQWLQRLVDAATLSIVSPAVIGAHQTVFHHLTILQRRQPMLAVNAQQPRPSFAIAEYH